MADKMLVSTSKQLVLSTSCKCVLVKWKVAANQKVSKGSILAVYKKILSDKSNESDLIVLPKFKSEMGGLVKQLLVAEGDEVKPGQPVLLLDVCEHKTIMKDMCAECGADLRSEPGIPGNLKEPVSASVALVHNIPELRVSKQEAEVLAKKDKEVLLKNKKLVLLVDLDQTLIHTTTENVPADMKDVYHFQLYGQNCWYHTKFRPGWKTFLEDMSKYYELHIFTMGSRMYAHTIARMLDPNGELFAERIRSRDESFDMYSKYRDLSVLFPCDDSMVCIIDDREDIWDCAPNLVTVKPYRFFEGTGDINAPPGSDQAFTHPSAIPLHENAVEVNMKKEDNAEITEGSARKPENDVTSNDGEKDIAPNDAKQDGKSGPSGGSSKNMAAVNSGSKNAQDGEDAGGCKDNGEETGARKSERDEKDLSPEVAAGAIVEESMEVDGTQGVENTNERSSGRQDDEMPGEETEEQPEDPQAGDEEESGHCATVDNDENDKQTSVAVSHTEDHDDYLLYLEEILRKIHQRFYEIFSRCNETKMNGRDSDGRLNNPPDLRCIMPEMRRAVLKGTNVVFTGVIPTNCRHEESQAWRIASQIGANVTKDLMTKKNTADRSKRTTHVIAARPGTEKACQASRLPNVKLVNPNWLWTCAERWEWVDERLFPVEDYETYKSRRHETPPESVRASPRLDVENVDNSSTDIYSRSNFQGRNTLGVQRNENSSDGFREALNPFLSFSSGEMEAMDKEVEDLMRSSEEEDDDDNGGDQEILGSVSSSSSSTENGDATDASSRIERNSDTLVGDKSFLGNPKGMHFSTIKQTLERREEGGKLPKRRKLDLGDDEDHEEKKVKIDHIADFDIEPEFSSCDESSESGSADEDEDEDEDDGNKMAAMLEAAINS